MYIVSYISKSQKGMSALLDQATKEARQGNLDLKKQVRLIGNYFTNSVETSAQEAIYLTLQIPLARATRQVVILNTFPPELQFLYLHCVHLCQSYHDHYHLGACHFSVSIFNFADSSSQGNSTGCNFEYVPSRKKGLFY
jgi:hypothetical protein